MNREVLLAGALCLLAGLCSPTAREAAAQSVLIDNYYSDWVAGATDSLKAELINAGYSVDYNTSAILRSRLDGYDVYTVFFPGQDHTLTPPEGAVIRAWVADGGGLWLGGGAGGYNTTESCNNVSGAWGVTLTTADIDGTVTDITRGHPVTEGPNPPHTRVGVFGLYKAATLDVSAGDVLARYSDGRPVMAVLTPGAGRAVILSDSVSYGAFDDGHLYQNDHLDLARNTVGYLVPEPATLALLGLGGLALVRRRRGKGVRT